MITDELRKYVGDFYLFRYKDVRESLTAIADRIDTAHEEAMVSSYFDGVFSDEELAENGFVRLPKDADGEFIRIGDTMEWMPHDKTYQPVIRVVSGVGADVFFAWSGANCQYGQYDAQAFRHYKQPTIEEVLTEFGIDWEHESDCEDRAALLAMPPKDRHGRQIEVGRNVFLRHNNRCRKVVHITRSDGGDHDQWIIGCDSGGAFLLPRDEDNVTLLRECPFCGYPTPSTDSMTIAGIKRAWVGCPNCGSRGPTEAMAIGKTEEEAAVDAWNDANWREP